MAFHAAQRCAVRLENPAALREFDAFLWSYSALSFLPHCEAGAEYARATPVLLCTDLANCTGVDVVVNLGGDCPDGYENFPRLVEIVSTAETDRAGARVRFRSYRDAGHQMIHHDLNQA
jgi:DNA polymerase-3 subunit chi